MADFAAAPEEEAAAAPAVLGAVGAAAAEARVDM